MIQYDREYVVVFSDWTDEDPMQVLRSLKRDGDYYAFKKNNVPSLAKVIEHSAYKQWFDAIWTR